MRQVGINSRLGNVDENVLARVSGLVTYFNLEGTIIFIVSFAVSLVEAKIGRGHGSVDNFGDITSRKRAVHIKAKVFGSWNFFPGESISVILKMGIYSRSTDFNQDIISRVSSLVAELDLSTLVSFGDVHRRNHSGVHVAREKFTLLTQAHAFETRRRFSRESISVLCNVLINGALGD